MKRHLVAANIAVGFGLEQLGPAVVARVKQLELAVNTVHRFGHKGLAPAVVQERAGLELDADNLRRIVHESLEPPPEAVPDPDVQCLEAVVWTAD